MRKTCVDRAKRSALPEKRGEPNGMRARTQT